MLISWITSFSHFSRRSQRGPAWGWQFSARSWNHGGRIWFRPNVNLGETPVMVAGRNGGRRTRMRFVYSLTRANHLRILNRKYHWAPSSQLLD